MNLKITNDDVKLITELCETISVKGVAEKFDCTPDAIRKALVKNGLSCVKIRDDYNKSNIASLLSKGFYRTEIAKELKLSKRIVNRLFREIRLDIP